MLILPVLLLILLVVTVISLYRRRQWADIWYSRRKFLKSQSKDLMGPLEEALRQGGLEPIARKGKVPSPQWRTFGLKGGLNLSGIGFQDQWVLYVGPVRDDNKREVEHVQQVIDKALEGLAR